MKNEIPTHILNHLLNNEDFCRRVVPYLKKEYFDGQHKIVFDLITDFVRDHNKLPTSRVLEIEIEKVSAPDGGGGGGTTPVCKSAVIGEQTFFGSCCAERLRLAALSVHFAFSLMATWKSWV